MAGEMTAPAKDERLPVTQAFNSRRLTSARLRGGGIRPVCLGRIARALPGLALFGWSTHRRYQLSLGAGTYSEASRSQTWNHSKVTYRRTARLRGMRGD